MKTSRLLLCVCLSLGCFNVSVAGQMVANTTPASPLQLSICPPVQLVPEDYDVTGLRLNLPYGYNQRVVGLDVGIYSSANLAEVIQVNVFNQVLEEGDGVQVGVVNSADSFSGLQISLFNFISLNASGLQIGLINSATDIAGLQIGLINTSETMRGLQIGLVNVISDSRVPFFIGINGSF